MRAGAASPGPGLTRRQGLAALLAGLLPSAQAAEPFDRGLLWRIERPGVASSHLFGTLHLDDARALDFRPAVHAALALSRLFVLEFLADADSAHSFEHATRLSGPQTLRGIAGEPVFDRVASVLATRYGMPPRVTDRLKPWAAYLALSRPARASGEIVDAALHRLARERGLPVAPLESLAEQVAAMDAVPLASQVTLLDRLAERHDEAQADIGRLVELYLAEDLLGMRRQQEAAMAGGAARRRALDHFLEQLLWRRNARMVERMQPHLQAGGAFVAMGALHLQGERGLPARLQGLGWQVQRVALGRRDGAG
jgi:uncharacterized protein YbaP (TraB family)